MTYDPRLDEDERAHDVELEANERKVETLLCDQDHAAPWIEELLHQLKYNIDAALEREYRVKREAPDNPFLVESRRRETEAAKAGERVIWKMIADALCECPTERREIAAALINLGVVDPWTL